MWKPPKTHKIGKIETLKTIKSFPTYKVAESILITLTETETNVEYFSQYERKKFGIDKIPQILKTWQNLT